MSGPVIRPEAGRPAAAPAGSVRPEAVRPAAAPAGSVRVAAIDCGTNSLRLLIADIDPARSELADVDRRMEIVRLGQGVDATGMLAPDALARTFRVLADFARAITDSGASAVRMVATSATRDASNADEFVGGVTDILGIAPEVVSGDEEATLSFSGATAELGQASAPGLSQASPAGLSQASPPGLSQASPPGLSQASPPGLSQASPSGGGSGGGDGPED